MSKSESPFLAKLKRANPSLVSSWAKRQAKSVAARGGYLVTKMDDEARRYARVSHNDAVPPPPSRRSPSTGALA